MSDDSARMLAGRVTHVIHCAASVRFDQSLATAAEANITVALELLEFAKRCRRLDKMVSVSTAYVTPHREGPLDEELVPLPFDAEQLYTDILAGRDARKAFAATGHPNTYTFTKCMAEHLLLNRREHVSIVLVRPSIVSATWRQPFPGWIDSTAALSSYLLMIGSGRLRSVIADPAARSGCGPVRRGGRPHPRRRVFDDGEWRISDRTCRRRGRERHSNLDDTRDVLAVFPRASVRRVAGDSLRRP